MTTLIALISSAENVDEPVKKISLIDVVNYIKKA